MAVLHRTLLIFALLGLGCGQGDSHPPPPAASGSGGKSGSDADKACWAKPDPRSCSPCCESEHPDGLDALVNAIDACVCKPSVCLTACEGSFCGPSADFPSDACNQCFVDAVAYGGVCRSEIDTTCNADPVCKAFEQCDSGCS